MLREDRKTAWWCGQTDFDDQVRFELIKQSIETKNRHLSAKYS